MTSSNNPKILGIDPGRSGALAFLKLDGEICDIEDMPTIGKEINGHLLSRLVQALGPVQHAVVERAQTMPKQGISGAFNYGVGYGVILGVLASLEIPVEVMATSWKLKAKLGQDKDLSRQRASQRWPRHAHYFEKVKDDGRAEAALMAWVWLESQPPSVRRRVIRRSEPS